MSQAPAAPSTNLPDAAGHFGPYGGVFVPETLIFALQQLEAEYAPRQGRPAVPARTSTTTSASTSAGRRRSTSPSGSPRSSAARRSTSSARTSTTPAPTRSTTASARRCSRMRMGKQRIIAETGAGQHGVATATAAALFGLKCDVYMGAEDVRRQSLNVFRMKLHGRRRDRGRERQQDAEGRHQRGDARLDGQRRAHALHHRQRRRPAPVPDDGPRLPERASAARRRQQCLEQIGRLPDVRRRLRRRRHQRGRHVLPVRRRRRRGAGRRRSRRPRQRARRARGHAHARQARRAARQLSATSCRTTTARPPTSTRVSRRPRLPRRRPRAQLLEGHRPRAIHVSITDAEALDGFQLCAQARRHPAGAGNGPRGRRRRAQARADAAKDQIVVVSFSGRGDKDCQEVARLVGRTS